MATMNISLPAQLKAFVESQVATGQFANASDYVRDIIRERQQAVERLRALIEEGQASGDSPYTIDEIIERAKGRFASRAA